MAAKSRSIYAIAAISIAILLSSCESCKKVKSEKHKITSDGASLFTVVSHCSAMNNTVEFFVDIPGSGQKLLAKGSDLEEFGQFYDDATRTIVVLTPNPSLVSVAAERVGSFAVRKAALHAYTPHDQQLLAKWSANPDDPEATRWIKAQAGL